MPRRRHVDEHLQRYHSRVGLDPGPVEQRLGIRIGAAARLAASNTISSPVGTIICIIPARCMLANRHLGALIGIWWKVLVPSRDFCLSS